MTRIAGTSAVLGGMLIFGGGMALVMILGAGTPILATGIGVALCGTTVKVGAQIYEKVKNSMEIKNKKKKAEELLLKLLVSTYEMDGIGQSKLGRKKEKNPVVPLLPSSNPCAECPN